MIIKRLFLVFIPVFIFTACEDDVDLKDLGIEPKMVLNCHLSPVYDTTIVFLSNSQPMLSTNSKKLDVINNATVEISKNKTSWVKFTYNSLKKRYVLPKIDFPILEGETYFIRAYSPDYKDTISSSCSVPYYRNINLNIDSELVSEEGYEFINCRFSWNDYIGENNYYSISTYYIYRDYDTSIFMNNVYNDTTNNYLFSDKGMDGNKMNGTYSLYMEYDLTYKDTLYFTVVQMDENAFLYEKNLMNNSLGDFLGFVEPTLMYNNIKNGYGIFGAMVLKNYYYILSKQSIKEL